MSRQRMDQESVQREIHEDDQSRVAPLKAGSDGQDLARPSTVVESSPAPERKPCRVCRGYGFIAQKRCVDDGYGEVDSCPYCEERRADDEYFRSGTRYPGQ